MPELPEVETIKRVLEPQIKGLKIMNITVEKPEVISRPTADEFCNLLIGQQISSVSRRGKFLIIHTDGRDNIILHLRMTGCLLVTPTDYPQEKHTHVIFHLDNGTELRFSDTRRFGRFWLIRKDEADTYSGIDKLGLEPFDDSLTGAYLQSRLGKRKKTVKERLLDQSIVAGIGNIYSDEILFAAGIYPARPANSLNEKEWKRLAHLAGRGIEMSRLGGGIGTRGPGESKLETDRRHIRRRIETLEAELKKLEKRRGYYRARRKKDNILTGAIVGYTNVGKSTLLNALTDSNVLAENKLFATLDITSRMLELPDGRSIMLTDTVGLIRRLPHQLIEAFKSTLEEAATADIIINIIDISAEDGLEQAEVTDSLLNELGCGGIPKIRVYNKADKIENPESLPNDDKTVIISAEKRIGFENLLSCIAANLPKTSVRHTFLIPYNQTSVINLMRDGGKIFSEEYTENGTMIDALVDFKLLHLVRPYIVEP